MKRLRNLFCLAGLVICLVAPLRDAAAGGIGQIVAVVAQILGVTGNWTAPSAVNQVPVYSTTGGPHVAWGTVPGGGSPAYPLLAPNGSASAPSYSFSSAASEGMYYNPSSYSGDGALFLGNGSFAIDAINGNVYVNSGGLSIESGQVQATTGSSGAGTVTLGYPTGYLQGCLWGWVSVTSFGVSAGNWRDKADLYDVRGFAAASVATTSSGALGTDAFPLAGITVTSSSGTAGLTASASIVDGICSAGAPSNVTCTSWSTSSTTLTGVGANFGATVNTGDGLAVGDLIGNATVGWVQITAIPTNTTLTLAKAFNVFGTGAGLVGGNVPAGTTGLTVIPGTTLSPTGAASYTRQIIWIAAGGTVVACDGAGTSWAAAFGGSTGLLVGAVPALQSATVNWWGYVWLESGTSGNTVVVSSQRVTPYSLTGYTTSVRRSGSLAFHQNTDATIANLIPAFQQQVGPSRRTMFEGTVTADGLTALSGGTATGYMSVYLGNGVSPTSMLCICMYSCTSTNQGDEIEIQGGQAPSGGVVSFYQFIPANGAPIEMPAVEWQCDSAQHIQYLVSNSRASVTIYITGFEETP